MPSYKPVTAALRVLDVLVAVNTLGERASVAEINHLTGIDKATIVRMLETLMHAGFVAREQDLAIYRPTGKTLSLSTAYDRHSAVSAVISDDLAAFRQRMGWPSDVALFDYDAMLVVKSSRQNVPLRFVRATGFRAPVLVTSLGLAYIANCPEDERQDFLSRAALDPAKTNEPARHPAALEQKLAQIRQQKYATMDESYSRDVYDTQFYSIGAPIMAHGKVFGAINVIYLRTALSAEAARDSFLGPLTEVAAQMAEKLANSLGHG